MPYYNRYTGSRRRKQNRLKITLLALLLLAVLGVAAYFILQDAVVFTSDGFHFTFSKDQKDPASASDDGGDVHLTIQEPQPATDSAAPAQPGTAPSAPTVPDVQPELYQTAAMVFSGESLLTDKTHLLRRFSQGGHGQMAFVVKGPDGVSLVDDDDVSDGISDQAAVFALELDSLEPRKLALFSALRDNVRPRTNHRTSAIRTQSGVTWLDREYTAWFDPQGEDTAECLLAMLRACEAAGFEGAVLQNFSYPTAGKLELIDHPEGLDKCAALTALAQDLSESAHLPLGLILTEEAASRLTDPASGQDVAGLAQCFDVLYAPAPDFSYDLTALQAAMEGTGCRAGLYVTGDLPVPADYAGDYLMAQ